MTQKVARGKILSKAYLPSNKNTIRNHFVNLAIAILAGEGDKREPLTLAQLPERMPKPDRRAHTNGITEVACSPCGRGNVPLRLDLKIGWLCALCARETDIVGEYPL